MTLTEAVAPGPAAPVRVAHDLTEPAFLSLIALTCVTAVGMGRLFSGGEFLIPVLAAALVAHGLSWIGRTLRLPGTLGLALAMAGVLLAAVWLVLPATTTWGIPWQGSLEELIGSLQAAGREFASAVAPAPATKGFLIASMIGIGFAAAIGDWAAFRVGSTFEALIPTFGLFLFTAILGAAQHRWIAVAAQLAAVLAFSALHGARTRAVAMPWFASRAQGTARALVQGAAVLSAIAVASALLLGPRLPGAHAQGIFDWRMRDEPGGGRRTTISPLVDIRNKLTERSNTEVFTVRSNERAYWRLTALDTFDGSIWSSNDSYKRAGGRLPLPGPRAPAREVRQQFAISNLASIWLPAAFRPLRLENVDGVSYNAESASLISKEETSDGLTYEVVSEQPDLTKEGLSGSAPLEGGSLARHLEVPPGLAPRIHRLAQRIVAGQTTPYGQALALQNHLRQSYEYDIDVEQGHHGRALEEFLFVTRRGYCEQFAGAYGVLARMVGLPSRVAVGFTPGEQGPDGTFRVNGLHAHAWPEVFLDGYGWVAFEPTPGRGAPRAEPYTGIPEMQASAAQPNTATTALPTTTTPTGAGGAETTTTTAADQQPQPEPERPKSLFERVLPWVIALATLLVGGWLIGVPALRRARRRRRRAEAADAAARVLVAWTEADETLGLAGARRRASETLSEHVRRVSASLPESARSPLHQLARDAIAASYAKDVPPEITGHAIAAAAKVESAVSESTRRGKRLRRELSLRP